MSNLIKAIEYRDLLKEIKELEEEIFGDELAKKLIQRPEQKEPEPKQKKPVDKGMVLALHAAGWKNRDIAREVKTGESYVSKIIQEAAAKADEERDRQRLADDLAKG